MHESDGSYFESFTALSWKRENRRILAVRTAESRAETVPVAEISGKINQMSLKFYNINMPTNIVVRFSQGHYQNGSGKSASEGANVYGSAHYHSQFSGM